MEESDVRAWLIATQQEEWGIHESLRPRIFAWVFRIALRILRDEAKADEAAAAVLGKLYLNRGTYDSSKDAKAYVYTVAVRVCVDMVRRKEVPLPPDNIWMKRASCPPTPLEDAMMKELIIALIECWSKLKGLERAALAEEVKNLAGAAAPTVIFDKPSPELTGNSKHQATYKARNKLRDCLRKAGHEFPEKGKRK